MPGHHATVLTDESIAFFLRCVPCAIAKSKCRSLRGMRGTTPLKMTPLCIVSASFCFSNPFSASEHCFQLPLLIRFIMSSKCLFVPSSVLISAWVTKSLWKYIFLIAKHTRSLSDSSSSKFNLLKASAWGICSPDVYVNSWSKPIRTIAHLVIFADAVFGISSSSAKRYLSGLWSVCRVNCLP